MLKDKENPSEEEQAKALAIKIAPLILGEKVSVVFRAFAILRDVIYESAYVPKLKE